MIYRKKGPPPSSASGLSLPPLSAGPCSPGARSKHRRNSGPPVAGGVSRLRSSAGLGAGQRCRSQRQRQVDPQPECGAGQEETVTQLGETAAKGKHQGRAAETAADAGTQSADGAAQPSAVEVAKTARIQQQPVPLKSRLDVLNPIQAKRDACCKMKGTSTVMSGPQRQAHRKLQTRL